MLKFIKKIKEYDLLKSRLHELELEVTALLSKNPLDLTRESLRLLPLERDFDIDGANESKVYIENLASFADNEVFKNEVKKIIHEQTQFIAEQSPTEQTNLISRGTINGAILLLERANAAKEFIEYQRTQDKG